MSIANLTLVRSPGVPQLRSQKVARQLQRFGARGRPAVTALADAHPRLAELALSFPGLLFTLAMRRGSDPARVAIAQVIAGSSLRQAAATVRLPVWLRALPPEAFVKPLPILPNGALLQRQIANCLPAKPHLAARWLAAVADAATWTDEPMALWLAREFSRKPDDVKSLRRVYLWAWHGRAPGTPGHSFIEKPWSMALSFAAAHEAAQRWYDRTTLWLDLGSDATPDMWAASGSAGGYDFVPLATAADIEAEAAAMRNCVMIYGGAIADDASRLWSVRRNGERIATLELSLTGEDWFPSIYELKHAGNQKCSAEIWWAARRWLNAQHLPYVIMRYDVMDRARWLDLWKPYWLSKQRIPTWLPLAPSRSLLCDLGRIGPAELLGIRRRRTHRNGR